MDTPHQTPNLRAIRSTSSTSPERAPSWYRNADALGYPDDCRAKCEQCHGHGSPFFFEVTQCASCLRGPNNIPCPAHVCPMCRGSGFVCPRCRGMRFVRSEIYRATGGAHQEARELLRCPTCTEGNNVHPERERRAIDLYLMRYRTWLAEADARGEPMVEPQRARQLAADAAANEQAKALDATQGDRRRNRQRKAITRSKAVEAQLDEGMPMAQPTDEMWQSLRSVVTSFRKPKKAGA